MAVRQLTIPIQEALLCLLCFDDENGQQIAGMLEPGSFDVYYRDIAEAAVDYRTRYKQAPKEHTMDLFGVLTTRRPDDAEVLERIHESMQIASSEINAEYVIKQAHDFTRYQRLRRGLAKAVDLLDQNDDGALDEVETTMTKAARGSHDLFDPGVRFHDTNNSLAFLNDDNEVAFPTGIPLLDRYGHGPFRKGLHMYLAAPNSGKSWWLVQLGKMAVMSGLKVCHITLEMSQQKVCGRYVQSFFSVSNRKEKSIPFKQFDMDEKGMYMMVKDQDMRNRPNFKARKIGQHLIKRMAPLKNRPTLLIKEFPTGQLTPKQLYQYLDVMETVEDFIPDLLLVDYVDLMRTSSETYRLDLGQLTKDLRGIAVERNIAVASVTQCNRAGETAKWVNRTHLAEDFSKVNTVDTLITYSQTKAEYSLGLGRLFVDKARNDIKHSRVLLSQAFTVGQYHMDSVLMNNQRYWEDMDQFNDGTSE